MLWLVRAGKRSRTAQAVAAERVVLADMGIVDDPYARGMLAPSMAAALWLAQHGPRRLTEGSVTLAGLAARVRWFDTQVIGAMGDGIDQVVTIGAGYDSRAWRLSRANVRFFELDHAASQADKQQRAPAGGPIYVEADLTSDSAADALHRHGLDSARPALFVVEGVTMYLGEDVVRHQFAELAATTSAGSRLAVDFYPAPRSGTAQNQRQLRLQRLARTGGDEGFRLQLDQADAVALVEACGWHVDDATSLRDAARSFVPSTSGLPVDAVNEHKSLVAARRT